MAGVVVVVAAAVVACLFAGSMAACSGPAAEAVSFWSGFDLAVPPSRLFGPLHPGDAQEGQDDECKDFNCNILSHGMIFFWNNEVCRVAVPEIGLKIGKDYSFFLFLDTRKKQRKSRLKIISGLFFYCWPTQYNSSSSVLLKQYC